MFFLDLSLSWKLLFGTGESMPMQALFFYKLLVAFFITVLFPLVCMRRCLFRLSLLLNCLSHTVQWYGVSPAWMRRCRFRFPFSEKCLSHILQWCGISPVWMRRCLSRLPLSENYLSHTLQQYVFAPVWMSMCLCRLPICLNCLSHTLQWSAYAWFFSWMDEQMAD